MNKPVLKTSSTSNAAKVGGAIAGRVKEQGFAEIHMIGGGAISQAVKGIAIARGFLEADGIDLISYPYFTEVELGGMVKTVMVFHVEPRGGSNHVGF